VTSGACREAFQCFDRVDAAFAGRDRISQVARAFAILRIREASTTASPIFSAAASGLSRTPAPR
jgi:hypothetical protein